VRRVFNWLHCVSARLACSGLGSRVASLAHQACCVAALSWASVPGSLYAQTESATGKKPAAAPAATAATPPAEDDSRRPAAITEVKPEVFYLRAKDGTLQAVPGFTFEDFMELYKLKQDFPRAAEPSRFVVDTVKLTGTARREGAELTAEIAVTTRDEGWLRVPLGLGPAMLTKPPTYQGPSEQIMEFDEKLEGYVVWLRGVRGKQHVLRLPLLAPLAAMGDETRLKLRLPRSTLASELELVVPQPRLVVRTPDGTMVRRSATSDGKGTTIRLTAMPAEVEVSWRAPSAAAMAETERLVADGTRVRATIDGQGTRFDATVVVRPVDGSVEGFDVRLPSGAAFVSSSQGSYTIASRVDQNVTIVQVRLARPSADPVTVRLVAQRARGNSQADESIDLSGFSVVGAVRQMGQIAVGVEGDWRVEWPQRREVREIDPPGDIPAAEREHIVAAYEFFRQPFALVAKLSPQKPHLTVDPQYTLTVEAERVVLEATLNCMIRGAKVSQVAVAIGGWEVIDIGPAGLVKADADVGDSSGVLSIPLAQRQRSKVRLTLRARKVISSAASGVEAELPRPVADVVGPATLTVQAADNVELTPVLERMPGLARAAGDAASGTETWQQPPHSFRQIAGESLRFVALRKIRPREVEVESMAEIRLDEAAGEAAGFVEQTFSYRVAYEPLEQIALDVPAALAGRGDLKFTVGGAAATATVLEEMGGSAVAGTVSTRRMAIRATKPLLGGFQVQARYRLPLETGDGKSDQRLVPLILPADGLLKRHQAHVIPSAAVRVSLQDAGWSTAAPDGGSRFQRMTFVARERQPAIGLELRPLPRRTTVDFAWIQTWFSGDMRQDRVVYSVDSHETVLRLSLPDGVSADEAEVWIDGTMVPVESAPSDKNELAIDLGAGKKSGSSIPPGVTRKYLVELLYRMENAPRRAGQTTIEGPRWLGTVGTQRTVWQVIFPPDEHVVFDPEGFTPEYIWGWYPVLYFGERPILSYWGRRPRWEQADQQRLTASSRADTLKSKTNRYSYSTLGAAARIELYTAPRSVVLLLASGSVLVVGLAFLFAPVSRRPAVVFVLAVALGGLAIYSPAWALLLAQASVLGMLLVGVAALLKRIWGRRRPVWLGAAGTGVDRSSSAQTIVRHDSSSRVTTTTAPLDFDAAMDVKP
jgi:hypothetical protein